MTQRTTKGVVVSDEIELRKMFSDKREDGKIELYPPAICQSVREMIFDRIKEIYKKKD